MSSQFFVFIGSSSKMLRTSGVWHSYTAPDVVMFTARLVVLILPLLSPLMLEECPGGLSKLAQHNLMQ